MKWIFESFGEWWSYTRSSLIHLGKGIARLIFAVAMGLASILVRIWKKAVAAVGEYPNIALGGFIVVLCVMSVLWFARYKSTKVALEQQRDSVAWQFQSFKEGHGYE